MCYIVEIRHSLRFGRLGRENNNICQTRSTPTQPTFVCRSVDASVSMSAFYRALRSLPPDLIASCFQLCVLSSRPVGCCRLFAPISFFSSSSTGRAALRGSKSRLVGWCWWLFIFCSIVVISRSLGWCTMQIKYDSITYGLRIALKFLVWFNYVYYCILIQIALLAIF